MLFKKSKKTKKGQSFKSIKNVLSKNHACYVLITCSDPSKDGKMQVEFNYSGDECLAAYLMEEAQNVIDNKINNLKN